MTPAETSIFDTITGLPVHPLVVHFAVVLLPLAALVQIALVFLPRWRARYAMPTLLVLAAGTAAAFAAKESGEALARRMGTPASHAFWGDVTPIVALALLVVTAVWWWLQRRDAAAAARSGGAGAGLPTVVSGGLSAALALAAVVLSVIVGHTGATAAWAGRLDTTATTEPAAAATTTPAATTAASKASSTRPATTTSTAQALTMALVSQHNTASSCYAAVDGYVYDLTAWIAAHPGGAGAIKSMCGTDATTAFHDQHGTERQPASRLATFKLGKLAA